MSAEKPVLNDNETPSEPEQPSWRFVAALGCATALFVTASNLEQHVIKPDWDRVMDKASEALSQATDIP